MTFVIGSDLTATHSNQETLNRGLSIMPRNYEYMVRPDEEDEDHGENHHVEDEPLLDYPQNRTSPKDSKYLVFIIFGFLGLASLLPWNFIITAKKYFDYKFRNTSLPSNASSDDSSDDTELQVAFESDLAMVSNGVSFLFSLLTVIMAKFIAVRKRMIVSAMIIFSVFVVTTVMVKIDTDSWQSSFLTLTLVSATIMSGAQSVLCSSVFGLAATFPSIYSQSTMIGQAAGGTFSAVVDILTKWTGGDAVNSAFIYFSIASAVIILALLSYFSLHFLNFSKFYMTSKVKSNIACKIQEPIQQGEESKVIFFWNVFKRIWLHCVSLAIVFMVTLSVFPAVTSQIHSQSKSGWGGYFVPVVCFLFFNCGDFAGRLFTFVAQVPGPNRRLVALALCILRVTFIPLLIFCNARPRSHLPVYLESDAWPIVLTLLMGISNGYLSTLLMAYGPMFVTSEQAEVAGTMLNMSMSLGLAAGSFLSFLFVHIL